MTVSNLVCEGDCKMMLSSRWMSAKQPRKRQTSFDIILWLRQSLNKKLQQPKKMKTINKQTNKQTNKRPFGCLNPQREMKSRGIVLLQEVLILNKEINEEEKNKWMSFLLCPDQCQFQLCWVSCRRGRGAGREEPQLSKCLRPVCFSQPAPTQSLSQYITHHTVSLQSSVRADRCLL